MKLNAESAELRLVRDALAAHGFPLRKAEIELRENPNLQYEIRITREKAGRRPVSSRTVVIRCPIQNMEYLVENETVSVAVRVGSDWRVVDIPRQALRIPDNSLGLVDLFDRQHRRSTGRVKTIQCSADLICLLKLALGYVQFNLTKDVPPLDWSFYAPAARLRCSEWDNYLDSVLKGVVSYLADYFSVPLVSDWPPIGGLLITGDTDNATEDDLDSFIEASETAGAACTLLIRRPSHLNNRVLNAVNRGHNLGIHPYSDDGTFGAYRASVQELSATIRACTGSDPVAARNHRFQWFEPNIYRPLLAQEGVQFDFNLVAATGQTWLGTPVGIGSPLPDPFARTPNGGSVWVCPTVMEDEVFLYDLDYCFGQSGATMADRPGYYVIAFLEWWIFELGLVACVNLHPEHSRAPYDRIQNVILDWAHSQRVPFYVPRDYLDQLERRHGL